MTVITLWNCLSDSSLRYQRSSSLCETAAIAVQPPDKRQNGQLPASTMKLGVVLSIMGGIVVISVSLGLLMLFLWRRGHVPQDDSMVIKKNPVTSSRFRRRAPPSMRMASTTLPPYSIFTLEEIEEATNNFEESYLLQEGPQCQVFKGRLHNGSAVLVKSLKLKQKYSSQSLDQYIEVVSNLRHRNLVSVLGQCIAHQNAAGNVFIVLEYVANGSLRDHLNDWRKRELLKWPQRMSIAMGIARGIQYLHSGGIVGNDLKIDSILLDESLTPKISSYNISLPPSVGAEGSLNNPKEISTPHQNPEKEDIYNLGVILVEVITGRPTASQHDIDDLHFQLERSLAESPSTLREHIDPSLHGTFSYESLKTVSQITVNCLSKDPAARPTVEDMLWHMQYSVQVQEGWGSSGNLSGNFSGNISGNLSGSFSKMMLNGVNHM